MDGEFPPFGADEEFYEFVTKNPLSTSVITFEIDSINSVTYSGVSIGDF